jgi:heterodisulfide reductase subunit B
MELVNVPDWSCCGSTPAHTVDHLLSVALSARNLARVEATGRDTILTPCPSCLTNLRTANHRMEKPEFREKVNSLLDEPLKGGVQTKSVLQALVEDIGMDKIAAAVTKPLKGLKVAPYYGCLMNRPPELMGFDDCENPVAMDNLMTALGADVVPFPLKTECCGGSFGVARRDIVAELSGRLLSMAKSLGANALVTACPLCQMNLDLRQQQVAKARKETFEIPVFYFTQLMGMAFDVPEKELGLDMLCVSPEHLRGVMESARREAMESARREAVESARRKAAEESARGSES